MVLSSRLVDTTGASSAAIILLKIGCPVIKVMISQTDRIIVQRVECSHQRVLGGHVLGVQLICKLAALQEITVIQQYAGRTASLPSRLGDQRRQPGQARRTTLNIISVLKSQQTHVKMRCRQNAGGWFCRLSSAHAHRHESSV